MHIKSKEVERSRFSTELLLSSSICKLTLFDLKYICVKLDQPSSFPLEADGRHNIWPTFDIKNNFFVKLSKVFWKITLNTIRKIL